MMLLLAASALLVLHVALGDEMAFVDVSSTDTITIRALDEQVSRMVGVRSLFADEPMAAHDWAARQTVVSSLDAQVAAWESGDAAPAGARLKALREELAPLYAVLPKNEHGRLDAGTVRYGLHRYFTKRYGWSVKGLEPAGAAWRGSMEVDEDVRQMSKYIVPSFLQELAAQKIGDGKGADLQWFAMLAATLRHIARAEVAEYLYGVYRTMGHPIAGSRSFEDAEDIVSCFMALYAFGTDLEVSAREDLLGARRYLDVHHEGWRELRAFLRESLVAAGSVALDFEGLLAFVDDFVGSKYSGFQSRVCEVASERLADLAPSGRAPLSALRPSNASGLRALFSEPAEELGQIGATQGGDVLVANYLQSPAMCLTTAGLHAVCCPSTCEALLERAEVAAGGPEASSEAVAAALGVDGAGLGGAVALHGRAFAEWLHRSFPLQCPAPGDEAGASPKTADEWMAGSGRDVAVTEAMIAELSRVLSRYTTLGASAEDRQAHGAAADRAPEAVVETVRGARCGRGPSRAPAWRLFGGCLQLAAVGSMMALALARGRSLLGSARGGGDAKAARAALCSAV